MRQGGEIKHMANGGDPFRPDPTKGPFEPTTGRYFTRPKEKEQPITFDEPIISRHWIVAWTLLKLLAPTLNCKVTMSERNVTAAITALSPFGEEQVP